MNWTACATTTSSNVQQKAIGQRRLSTAFRKLSAPSTMRWCHGNPEREQLKDGEIVNIGIARVIKGGWFGDPYSRCTWLGKRRLEAQN